VEAFESLAVEMQVVAAGKPDDEMALIKAKAQGATAQGDVADVGGEVAVVAVALAAVLAAALQALAGVELEEKLPAAADDARHAAGGDEAVQVLERAQVFAGAPEHAQAVLASFPPGRGRSLQCHLASDLKPQI
jgi:hypothetical protein